MIKAQTTIATHVHYMNEKKRRPKKHQTTYSFPQTFGGYYHWFMTSALNLSFATPNHHFVLLMT